jgi:hypothetical protein
MTLDMHVFNLQATKLFDMGVSGAVLGGSLKLVWLSSFLR